MGEVIPTIIGSDLNYLRKFIELVNQTLKFVIAELNEKKIRLIERLLYVSDKSIIAELLDYFSAEKSDLSLGTMSEEELKNRLRESNEDIVNGNAIPHSEIKKRFGL
jgi:D-ribose pyranose/furanose isomerase RbsD